MSSHRSVSPIRTDVKPVPQFSSTALEIQNSPPLTSSLHSRQSASSAQESAYLRQASRLRWARLALSVLLVGVGATIVGSEGHALHEYNETALGGAFFLPLWPANLDLRPTTGSIAAGAVIILSSLVYFLVALIPSPRSRTLHLTILFLLTTTLGLAASILATVYTATTTSTPSSSSSRDTLHSWTCKWYNGARSFNADALALQLPLYANISSPSGFGRLCRESAVGGGFAYAAVGVEGLALVVAVVGLWGEWGIKRVRRERALLGAVGGGGLVEAEK